MPPNSPDQNIKPAVESEILATPVLIVDDIQDNLDLLDEMLAEEGHTCVIQALSGTQALQVLESRADVGLAGIACVAFGLVTQALGRGNAHQDRLGVDDVVEHLARLVEPGQFLVQA